MNPKTAAVVGVSLLAAGFLLGFIPQYLKGRHVHEQLDAAHVELATARETIQRQELGLLIGQVYLETNRKNFGLASQHATRFFDAVRAMAEKGPNGTSQSLLQSMLVNRDPVIGGLAKADPATAETVQSMFQQLLAAQAVPK